MESEERADKALLKKYEVALATRNFEIELFWKRSLFFWGFIASAFIGYAAALGSHFKVSLLIASFGLVCSFAWTLVNRGSKRWQENWEILVSEMENDITGSLFKERRYKEKSPSWLGAKKYSVSKIAIALSDFTVLVWILILIRHLSCDFFEIIVILMCIIAIGLMFHFGKSSD